MSHFKSQITEIRDDPALRRYGAALALVQALTAVFWLTVQPLGALLDPGLPPICWPFLQGCDEWRALSPAGVNGLVVLFFLVALANAWLFLDERSVPFGWWLLVVMTVVKAVVLLQDFRLVLNQHYMASWITLTYLFIPQKRWVLPRLIVLFYVWAGLLKLNPEWISGDGLYGRRPLGMPSSLVPAACVYVIVLELFVAFGLLSRRRHVLWSSLAQILLFHVASFWVVGFFYPLLMFLILSVLVPAPEAYDGLGFASGSHHTNGALARHAAWPSYALLGGFCLMQVIPNAFPGDRAITGEGRVFALNMFDAPVACIATVTTRSEGHGDRAIRLRVPFLHPRIECDPIVYFAMGKHLCRQNAGTSGSSDFELQLESRRARTDQYQLVVAIPSFCSAGVEYSMVRHNTWLLAR